MYKNILVPHAGTTAGNKALAYAKEMAKKHQSKITLLHVVEKIHLPASIGFSYKRKAWAKDIQNAQKEMKNEMHEKLTELANRLKKEDISVAVKVIHGYPDEEIIRIIKENSFDTVIMAKRRKLPGLKAILQLGSVSRKVLERASCPVMLIDGAK
ncbi:MAG: universal stress protein [Nitrosopumilus sp.]|nr:universal stress protein [Nitrosopumilus sp.]